MKTNNAFSNHTGRFTTACPTKLLPLFLLLVLPAVVQAQFTFTTNNGAITITGYTGPGGAVTIPDTTNGLLVATIGTNAFIWCSSLTSVTIPNSVTSIGDFAFFSCYNLTKLTIGTSVTNIGDCAFSECDVTNVTIPNSMISIGVEAFSRCTSLTSVTIGNSVTSIGDDAFFCCLSLTSVTIPDGVTSIGDGEFMDCSSLTGVTIPNSVTNIGEAAFCSSGLTNAVIPNSVTSIGYCPFVYCESLSAITVDALNPFYSSVDGVLFNKSQTTLIECPGGKTGSCTIPDSVTSIEDEAFEECWSLTSVTIGTNVTNIGEYAFYETGLTGVTIPCSVTNIEKGVFYDCANLTSVTIPGSVTSIGDSAFFGSGLTNVTIPNSVTNIGDEAFCFCTNLTSVTIGSGVTNIGDAFDGCSSLAAIAVDALNPVYSSVAGVLFNKSQTTLIQYPWGKAGTYMIPSSVTSIGSIGDAFFVFGIGYAFFGCSNLTSVSIPSSVTNIGEAAFRDCYSLTAITVDTRNSVYSDVDGVLFNQSLTTLIEYPGGLVGSYTIPDFVTSIGDYAFSGCSGLTSITIPSGVTNIGDLAFSGCSGLTSVYFAGNAPSLGSSVFCVPPFLFGETSFDPATIYYLD